MRHAGFARLGIFTKDLQHFRYGHARLRVLLRRSDATTRNHQTHSQQRPAEFVHGFDPPYQDILLDYYGAR
jgi:hypothetical protein